MFDLEMKLLMLLLLLCLDDNTANLALSDPYLTLYIALKHGSEVVVLLLAGGLHSG